MAVSSGASEGGAAEIKPEARADTEPIAGKSVHVYTETEAEADADENAGTEAKTYRERWFQKSKNVRT